MFIQKLATKKEYLHLKKSMHDLWNDFRDCWASVYSGFSHAITLDREISLLSEEFRESTKDVWIKLQFTGIEAQNAIGKGEQYHYLLRRIYDVVGKEHQCLPKIKILITSIKAINNTVGPYGWVPSILVYWVISNFPDVSRSSKKKGTIWIFKTLLEQKLKP